MNDLGTFPMNGEWSVWINAENGTPEMIEGDLPEEIARQMVADYAAEGEAVWMAQESGLAGDTPECV